MIVMFREFDYDNKPVVEIVNEIIEDSIKKGASDIHFDPEEKGINVRIRIDGELHDYCKIPESVKKNLTTRVKIISGMNITESRLPQDGAIKHLDDGKQLDLRVSSLPTIHGEKIVIRILDYSMSLAGLETLGFTDENYEKVKTALTAPNGIILVTGATGSGKSTTVYSMLQLLNTPQTNIITVEDPVEMKMKGLNQVQVMSEIGLDFNTTLRSILRQDPNIIMIGEIRDDETARIAVRASITGHKVLSTIHTNNSLNTIERLTDMDVERYLLGSALTGIISQKLARRLCPHCKILRNTSEYEKTVFRKVLHKDIEQMYDANPDGCEHCFRGFTDRIAILEVLLMNDDIRDAITNNMHKDELRKLVYKSDVITLLQDGLIKVVEGETSFSEILKVVDLDNDLSNYEDDNLETGIRDIENQETNTNINHEINKPDIQEIDAFNPDDHYVSLEPVTTNNNEIIDYSALIPKDVENHNNEIPHDTIKPGEIEYFNF